MTFIALGKENWLPQRWFPKHSHWLLSFNTKFILYKKAFFKIFNGDITKMIHAFLYKYIVGTGLLTSTTLWRPPILPSPLGKNLWMVWILSVNCTLKWPNDLYETGLSYSSTILKNVTEKKLQQVEFLQRKQRVTLLWPT